MTARLSRARTVAVDLAYLAWSMWGLVLSPFLYLLATLLDLLRVPSGERWDGRA